MSMVSFNIIDGEDYYKKYDDFVEEYNKGTLQREILKMLQLSDKKYRDYLHQAIEEGLVEPRLKKIRENAKYYTRRHDGKYIVIRRDKMSGKYIIYGTYDTVEEAKVRVRELKCNGWVK